jgi:hypothetical protein
MATRKENEDKEEEKAWVWERETVPRVMEIVGARLPQRDVYSLLLTNPWCYRALLSNPQLWQVSILLISFSNTHLSVHMLTLH